ncbi:MAG TPA: pantoate--beta-alanine ligase [Gammaproteobacteria bacterium]|nr:pantoate--beta-alanine ligase [Gammaproteobacteria bacterium]
MATTKTARVVRSVSAVRAAVAEWRAAGDKIAFAPTMGNLHAGHMSLAALCAQAAPRVVMSIFVNPAQFGPSEDFGAYPRTLAADEALIASAGNVDLLFVPDAAEVYPFGLEQAVRLQLPALSRELCGASRPGHFDGVATVVCRLLNIVTPDVLFLGQKDYQQFVLMQRMIADLHMPVDLRMGSTLREPDGLAMSSRNRYLDAAERKQAPVLYAALSAVREQLLAGAREFSRLTGDARAKLERAGFHAEYVEIRRQGDLGAADAERAERRIVLGAARLGRTRLIDNLFV